MQPNIYSPPLANTFVDDISKRTGLLENLPLLDLDLPDKVIIQNIHGRIQNSQDYFNEVNGFNLRNKRIKNMRMLHGDQINENQLYHYQTPWQDNELFVGVDAIIAYVTASIAQVETYPASKRPESRILATDLSTYIKAYNQKLNWDKIIDEVVMNLVTQYVGIVKYEWNGLYGKDGEIIPRAVSPMNYFVDKNCPRGGNPAFEGEVLKDTVEGLIAKFPDQEQKILQQFDIKRKGAQNTTKEVAYREVWFTYYDKDYKPQEAVAWYLNDLVLDKKKNPNWLYDGEGDNFLDNPRKPYITFNLFNNGEHVIDLTSSVEQAIPMQDVLNKLGRQIIDNLSTANGFRLVLAGAMTDDALENLTGDPNQSVIVKAKPGQGLDDVYKQISPHIVSEQLINSMMDSRNTVHGILGTPSQFRGDDTDQTKTASEALLIKDQASGRQDKVVRAINSGLGNCYEMLTQMITVWYTEKHKITSDGGDGNFDFIEMHQSKIEPGMTIRVYDQPSGDKARLQAVAQNAAKLGFLAPIDYYKFMRLDNPQKLYDNLVKFKSNAQSLAMDLANNSEDRDAIVDFDMLMGGQTPEKRTNPTPEYLDQFRKRMITDEYLAAKPKIQKKIVTFVLEAAKSIAQREVLEQASNTPLPPAELPPQVQETLPPPQPQMGQIVPVSPTPMGQPPVGPPQGMGQPPMPQAPMNPAQRPVNGPLPPLGIQGVMQQASAPNLNPTTQPQPPSSISSLTPR